MSVSNLPIEPVESKIYQIRGMNVMIDSDLAELYQVPVKRLNEQVKRNIVRFPVDFAFQLTDIEWESLRSQFATLKTGRGEHKKYPPLAFTEQGIAMLSGVLNSHRAIQVNLTIMRTFVKLRSFLDGNKELLTKLNRLEEKYDIQFKVVFDAIKNLINERSIPRKKILGLGKRNN